MAKNKEKLSVAFLFDDTLDSNDGVAQYVKTLGGWLSGLGYEVSYLVGETKIREWQGGKVYSLAKNKSVVFNGNKLSMPVSSSKRKIQAVLDAVKPDILHVMVPYSPFMAARVIKLVPPATNVVGTFHIFPSGRLSETGSKVLAFWLRRTLKRFDKTVSVSRAAQEFAHSGFGIESAVIPNPVSLSKFKAGPHDKNGQRIVFLGRLVKRKGADKLIDAFAVLLKQMPDVRLVIAGDGQERKSLERQADKLGVSRSVDFLGFISEEAKPALLSSADIACFPSLYGESFGIVLIEAMASGAGVVLGGDNPGYRSVLDEQKALLVDPANTTAFAQRLNYLLSDKDKARQLHEWQLKTVKQYDIDIVGRQILEVYNGQIAHSGKKSNNRAHE